MTGLAAFEVKGWCPGALRPMLSGDGLIVRIRPPSARLGADQVAVLADGARRFGNGHIDLTRRANLQIRGISGASLPPLQDVIQGLGLLDADPDVEAIRNIMINPLAGIDPAEVLDVRGIATELADLLASETSIRALPAKFSFIVDGGGVLPLGAERGDVRLAAIGDGPDAAIALGLETATGTDWLGSVAPDTAAAAAIATALAFIAAASREGCQRMRNLSEQGRSSIGRAMRPRLDALCPDLQAPKTLSGQRIGLLALGCGRFAVGLASPFGRVEADQLRTLADAMAASGVHEIRLSPWRVLYAEVRDRAAGQAILDIAAAAGFIIEPRDPLLQIEACPGAPGCRSTALDTRSDARRLAGLLTRYRFEGTAHVSGCAKGCAKSGAADLVLVGTEKDYGILHNATTRARPGRRFSFDDSGADPGALFDLDRGDRHD